MRIFNRIFSKILSKSNSYNFYKNNYEDLNNQNKNLTNKLNEIQIEKEKLLDTYVRDVPVFDFEDILSKFYISPAIKYPFSFYEKRCFATMEHLAKYVRNNLKQSSFKPLVSVILSVSDCNDNIVDCINSVLKQTYDNFELIIVNDCCDDDSLSLIKTIEDSRIEIISNQKKQGFAFCRNVASQNINGDYVFYIDENNLWDFEYLSTMMGLFLILPDADAIYSGQYIYNKNFKNLLGVIFGSYNKSLLYNNNYISISALAHKKVVFDKISFDETLSSLEDYHFILNIAKYFKMYSAPFLLSKFQAENNSFHKTWGLNEKLDISQINLVHEKVGNNIFKDLSEKFPLKKKISIIIPSFMLLDDLKEGIETILSFNSKLIDIIVVDNNSEDTIRKYLKSLSDDGKIKYIQNDVNYGFTYAIQQGISISDKNSDILLLNNDAILKKGSLEAMQYYAYSIKDCGIIVPREVLYPFDKRINSHVPYANKNFECDVTPSRKHTNISKNPLFFDGDILELNFAPFFCTYIKREVYNKTLGLDAEIGRHYMSDRLFCYFVRYILNLKVYQVSDAIVYHKSQASTKKLKKNKKQYNTIYIKNQWEDTFAEELGFRNYSWQE